MFDFGISADDIDREVRGALDAVDQQVITWVDEQVSKATRRLLATCPTLRIRLENDAAIFDVARDIVIEAVARLVRVDEDSIGLRSESEDGYSYQIDPLTRSGNIWFPDKDLALLGCGSNVSSLVPRSARLAVGTTWAYGGYGRGR